jgi:formamidopyrimidine-DNA glycosylase
MSVEAPEARILAGQMNEVLPGKVVASCRLEDYERLQRMGFLNRDVSEFDQLRGGKVESVSSRGNVVRMKLDNGVNLIIGPEYGGRVHFHADEAGVPSKIHLRLDFTDDTVLTVRLTGMGVIKAVRDEDLGQSYVYRRDFSEKPSPLDEGFDFDSFSQLVSMRDRGMKSLLVGKEALVVGLSNSAFQDIIYRAGIHPKRRGSDLSEGERRALYDAVRLVVQERLWLGGKDQFLDLYQRRGAYVPAMGPQMKNRRCPKCGSDIEKMGVGGGQVYMCPECQK